MKKEISPSVIIAILIVLVGGIIAVFARSSGCGHDPTKLNPNDYKLRPDQMRAKLHSGGVGTPTR